MRAGILDLKVHLACSLHSGTLQQRQSHLPPLGPMMAAAEKAAAGAPAHQAGSRWTTSSASFPVIGSRRLLQYEGLRVSLLLAFHKAFTKDILSLDFVQSFTEGQKRHACCKVEGM